MIYLIFIWQTCFSAVTYLPKTQTLDDKANEMRFETIFQKSTARFDHDGEKVDFFDGEYYQSLENNVSYSYGLNEYFQTTFSLRTRLNQSGEINPDNSDEINKNSVSGIESGGVNFKYAWPVENKWQYAVEFEYRNSFYKEKSFEETDGKQINLGDGGNAIAFGPSFSFISENNNFLSGRFLYRLPAPDLSSELFTEIEGALVWRRFSLFFGIENNYSFKTDAYTEEPLDKPVMATGSTARYNSINRAWMAPYAGAIFAISENWRVEAKVTNYMSGQSVDEGMAYLVSLSRRTGTNRKFEKYNKRFKTYSIEGAVSKLSPKKKYVIVDRGISDGLKVGMRVDFFFYDYLGGNELIATGYVVKVAATKSMVRLSSQFSKRRVKEGTVIRSGINAD
jgi:hypothetical protein